MIAIENKVNRIVDRMEYRKANGEKFPHGKALVELALLSLSRIMSKLVARSAKTFTCDVCTKTVPHKHEVMPVGYEFYYVENKYDLQFALDNEFGYGWFKVSNPLFGGTFNVKYLGQPSLTINVATRRLLKEFCGLELHNDLAAKRKVCAVVSLTNVN